MEALEKFIVELQKKYTDLERKIEEKNEQIGNLCDKDWARNLEFLKTEQSLLDRFNLEKEKELQNIQRYVNTIFQPGGQAPNVHLLEEQSRELALTKRMLIEKENRNNECGRKWRDLYDVRLTFYLGKPPKRSSDQRFVLAA